MGVKSALKAASKLKGKGGTRYMTAAEREKALARKKERMQNANKRRTTSAQRTYGKGRAVGKSTGRKQGAAAGIVAGVTVSEIRNMKSKSNLKKMMEAENLSLAQKNAIQETLLKLADEQIKTTRTVPRKSQSPKPKLRKAAGGSIDLEGKKSMGKTGKATNPKSSKKPTGKTSITDTEKRLREKLKEKLDKQAANRAGKTIGRKMTKDNTALKNKTSAKTRSNSRARSALMNMIKKK